MSRERSPAPRGTSPSLRILVADGDALVRQGVRCIVARVRAGDVVEEAESARQLAEHLEREPLDLVLVDAELDASPAQTVALVERSSPGAHAIVLGPIGDLAFVREAFAAGAKGYVAKDEAVNELPAAIDEVADGGRYLDPRLGADLAAAGAEPDGNGRLTGRERDVLALVVKGLTNNEIAARLGRPVRTVEGIRLRGQHKLGVSTRAALVEHAARHGLEPAGG